MPKKGFKKYYDEQTKIKAFSSKYIHISGFNIEQKKEFASKIREFTFTRTVLDTMIVGSLLSKYTFNQIFSPNENEKAAINRDIENEKNRLYSMVHRDAPLTEDEKKEFHSYAAEKFLNVVLASKDFVNNVIKDDYSFENLSLEERAKLYTVCNIQHDAYQEMIHVKTFIGEKYKQLVDKDGEKELTSYYEDVRGISANVSGILYAQVAIQPTALNFPQNEGNVDARTKAEFDVTDLISGILPNMVAESFISDYINKQNEKDISKMNVKEAYTNGFSLGQAASMMVSKEQKEMLTQMMLNPVTKDALLSYVVDADNKDIFSVNPESGEVSFEPLFNNIEKAYDIAYGQFEMNKNVVEGKEINDYGSEKHFQLIKLTDSQKEDLKKGVSTGYTVSRSSFETLFWGRMLLKGYSIDELLNYNENSSEKLKKDLEDEKKVFLEEKLPKEEELNNIEKQKAFDTYAAEAYIKVLQEARKEYTEKYQEKKSFGNMSLAEKKKASFLAGIANDASQEKGKIETGRIIGEADFERIFKEQNPGKENTWNEFKEFDKRGVFQITTSVDSHKEVTEGLIRVEKMIKGKTEEEIRNSVVTSNFTTTIGKIIAVKVAEKSYADLFKDTTIDKAEYLQTYSKYDGQVSDLLYGRKKPWVDEDIFVGILSDRFKLDAFMTALNGEPEDLCTVRDGNIVDFNPINEKAIEINNTPIETLIQDKIARTQEKTIKSKVVKIADLFLSSTKREEDIKKMSNNEKIEMVMNMHCMANGSGHIYGEEYNDNNPNASSKEKVSNYIKELTKDALEGSNVEMYAFLPNKKGQGEVHKISNYSEFTFGKAPKELFGNNEKSYKIKALEDLKMQLDKNGKTSWDSKEYKEFKKCLDDSIEPLKRTLSIEKKNEILNELASKADAYYIAKITSSQNDRRSVRFNAASVLRNINQDEFNKKVNMRQNILEKVAYLYAQDKVKNGTPAEKNRYKVVTEPYNREQLGILTETISLNPNLKKALDNCKDDKQLKSLFDKIKDIKDIPEAKNVVKPIENKGPAVVI